MSRKVGKKTEQKIREYFEKKDGIKTDSKRVKHDSK